MAGLHEEHSNIQLQKEMEVLESHEKIQERLEIVCLLGHILAL